MLKFKALGDETRIRLINILSRYELSVNELAGILGGQSRISRHLKVLVQAGLLRSRKDGQWVYYSCPVTGINNDFLRAILPFLPKTQMLEADIAAAVAVMEERASRAREFFNAMAEKWDDLNQEIIGNLDLTAKALDAMPQNCQTAVDLGCGTGRLLGGMADKVERVIGVDASASMLELCKKRLIHLRDKLSLRIGEIDHLPLADGEADFACLNFVMHHLPAPAEVFKEIGRTLAPGGILFITDFLRHDDESMRFTHGDYWLGFNPPDLFAPLSRSGFEIVSYEIDPCRRKFRLFFITARKAATTINKGALE